jgi:PAS domain S-box-containing protein
MEIDDRKKVLRQKAEALLKKNSESEILELIEELAIQNEEETNRANELINANKVLAFQQENLRKIASLVPGVVYQYLLRPDGTSCFPYASEAIKEIYRVSPDEVREDASSVFANLHPDDFAGVVASIQASGQTLTMWQHEYRVKFSDGTIRSLYGHAVPQREEDGSVLWHGFITDITERKLAENELYQVSARLALATRAGGIGTWDYDSEHNILVWDDLMYELYGIEKNDFAVMHDSWKTSIHPDDLERSIAESKKALLGEKEYDTEFRVTWPDGSVHNIRALAIIQRNSSGQALRMIGTNWDITELRKAEKEKLDDSENRYRSIFQGSPDGILIFDKLTKTILFANPKQCEVLGYTEDELKTMTIAGIHPSDTFQDTLAEFESLARGEKTMASDIQCLRKNGEIFYADIASSFMTINGRTCIVGFFRDITQRRQVEVSLKDALVKAEASNRLKTAFINNISHEVRTPLNGIMGFGSLLTDPKLTSEDRHRCNQLLKASGNRLINTITDYMDISLIASENIEVSLKPVNVSDLLKELQAKFQDSCNVKKLAFNLTIPLGQEHFTLITDIDLLRKIISSLLDNAIKFTSLGSITFGYSVTSNTVGFYIHDTGIGIAPEFHQRIFEPFMQEIISDTRGYEGSGLGLSIIKGFLKLLESDIRLESVKGQGASFFFSLPMKQETTKEHEAIAPPVRHAQIISPVVLIAEDDLSSDLYIEIILKTISAVVLKAANGKEAVEMCHLHPEISLVLMDLKMPVMDGLEATRQIKSFKKELPVIAVTAYAFSKDKKKALEAGCDDFLSKPVSKAELQDKLRKYGLME